MTKRVTLDDVAKEAGVSLATVSAVLNNKVGRSIRVSEDRRKLVMECSKRLGYVPNVAARNLKTGENNIIAVFTYENFFPVEYKNEFYDFFVGIQEEAEKQGYDLIILNNWSKDNNRSARIRIASGAIMIGVTRDDAHITSLVKQKFPLVFVGRREIGGGLPVNFVAFDYRSVVHEAISKLMPFIKKGMITFVRSVNRSAEFDFDKSVYLAEALEGKEVKVDEMEVEKSGVDEIISHIRESGIVIFDRLYLLNDFEPFLKANGLIAGENVHGLVFEDDWMGNHGDWCCWNNRRRELGALAVRYMISHLKGMPFGEDHYVHINMQERKSLSFSD